MAIDQGAAMRVSNAAQALAIARKDVERAKDWRDQVAAQKAFDAAQEEMSAAGIALTNSYSRDTENA